MFEHLLRNALLAAALALILGGGPAFAADTLGTDLQGLACHAAPRTDLPAERNAPQPLDVFCGDAKRPVGTVSATFYAASPSNDVNQRHQSMARAAETSAAGRVDAMRLSCTAGKWGAMPGGADLYVQSCVLNDSEWPQVVAVAPLGGMLVRAEGLPSTLPALERAMARLVGVDAAKSFGTPDAARARLVAVAGDRWLGSSANDFDGFGELTETARVEASRKNFGSAEDHYRRAIAIVTKVFGERSPVVGLLVMELALQVSNQERFDEAAALFRRADPIIQTNGTAADRARLLLYQAFDAANRGRFDQAIEFSDNSASTWRGIVANGNFGGVLSGDSTQSVERGELAFTLDLEAEMALRTGNLAAADAAVSEAEGILASVPGLPPWWKAEVLTTIGELRAAQGRMDDADRALRAALIIQQRLFGATAPTAITYLSIGRIFSDQKLYRESVRAFRLALEILRKDEVARSEVVVDQITPFVIAANALMKEQPAERAKLDAEIFEASQLIGKSLVDDTVNRVAARLAEAAPAIADLVDRLEQTRRRRDAARIALAEEVSLPNDQRGSQREQTLMNEINTATGQADSLQALIEKQFPDYANFAHPGPVSLAAAQKQLAPGEALVFVETGRERSYVMMVRNDRMEARPIATNSADLGNAIANLRKAFVVRGGAVEAFDTTRAAALYRSLFGPIEGSVKDVTHLIVVPTGPLASLPLGLLVTQAPKAGAQRDYENVQWLVRRSAISEVPSARAFVAQREQPRGAADEQPLLAIANPDFAGSGPRPQAKPGAPSGLEALDNQCRDEGPVPPDLLRTLAPLPDTADEVHKVAAILHADNGSLLIGDDATEPRFRAMPLDKYRVLYFATHGLLPTSLKCQSEPALVLTPPATLATSRDADGVLDASEVAQLHLSADLVVLSACNTATAGGQFGGESLSGLAKAFFHAGARSVLASHWEVPSAQTVQLMTGMFERLGPSLQGGVAEALRQSQLALIAKHDTAHPFFWAAFTLIGDGGAAPATRSTAALTDANSVAQVGVTNAPASERHQ